MLTIVQCYCSPGLSALNMWPPQLLLQLPVDLKWKFLCNINLCQSIKTIKIIHPVLFYNKITAVKNTDGTCVVFVFIWVNLCQTVRFWCSIVCWFVLWCWTWMGSSVPHVMLAWVHILSKHFRFLSSKQPYTLGTLVVNWWKVSVCQTEARKEKIKQNKKNDTSHPPSPIFQELDWPGVATSFQQTKFCG